MTNERKRKQHYVPRFYLKNFAFLKNGEYYIHCLEKSNQKQFVVNIKDVGCENLFYEVAKNAPQEMEDILSQHEERFVQVYNKLVASPFIQNLKWKEKEVFAQFIVIQELRTREMREHLRSMIKNLNNWLSNKPLSENLEKQLKEVSSEEGVRSLHLGVIKETLLGKNPLVEMLLDLKWIIYENYTKIPFWTSDHPVNRYNPIDFSPYGNLGLQCRGIQIFFPLTPKLGIAFCDPFEYFFNPEKMVCIKDNVLFDNTLQLGTNTRHVFSLKPDFSIAKKWLDENPKSSVLDRNRISSDFRVNPEFSPESYFFSPEFRYFNIKKYRQDPIEKALDELKKKHERGDMRE
ncbi:MAG: DUF4238 domain-containing protein [Candidatus Bathyarchaeia archaeon]